MATTRTGGAAAAASSASSSTMPAVSALDDRGALQYRLALGAATGTAATNKSRGGRGTLTRSAQNLLVDLLRPTRDNRKSSSSLSVSPRDAARELRLLQIEMNKMVLVLNRIRREAQQLSYDERRGETASSSGGTDPSIFVKGGEGSGGRQGDDFKELSQRVHELRHQVRTAQQAQACQAEYEALASLLHRRHSVPSSVLQSQIDAIDRRADAATNELRHKQESLQVRTAQVSALVQSILDLKQSLLLASEGGNEASDAPMALAASTPSSTTEARSSGSGNVPAKKRRRNDSGGDELAGAAAESSRAGKRTDASVPDEPSDMEEGEESNDNSAAKMDSADDRKGDDGPEEELYGDL